jgi:hypothetical protein
MREQTDREPYRRLPDPVLQEDLVETVDTASLPVPDGSEDRDRLLRDAGGA